MPKKLAYKRGSLLFHSTHGLCRITDIIKKAQDGPAGYCYVLRSQEKMFRETRFVVEAARVETSGFHPTISANEANKILSYLRNPPKIRHASEKTQEVDIHKTVMTLIEENAPWAFGKVLSIYSQEKNGKGAKGKREMLSRAAKGLTRELSFALNSTQKEACDLLQKTLAHTAKKNFWVLQTISTIRDSVL